MVGQVNRFEKEPLLVPECPNQAKILIGAHVFWVAISPVNRRFYIGQSGNWISNMPSSLHPRQMEGRIW